MEPVWKKKEKEIIRELRQGTPVTVSEKWNELMSAVRGERRQATRMSDTAGKAG